MAAPILPGEPQLPQLLQDVSLNVGLQLPGGGHREQGKDGPGMVRVVGMWLAGGLEDKKAGNSLL